MKNASLFIAVSMAILLVACSHQPQAGHHHETISQEAENIKSQSANEATNITEGLGVCPVMGMPAQKQYSYVYEGKTYYFCCPSCIELFQKNPQKYISNQ